MKKEKKMDISYGWNRINNFLCYRTNEFIIVTGELSKFEIFILLNSFVFLLSTDKLSVFSDSVSYEVFNNKAFNKFYFEVKDLIQQVSKLLK